MSILQRRWGTKGRRRTQARRIGQSLEALEARALLTTASFAVTSDWGTGVGAQITITNTTATPVNNWSLGFSWDHSITSIWNGAVTSHSGNQYVVSGASWDLSIPANGSVSFGFNATPGNVGADVPAGYTLNGVSLGANLPSLSINSPTLNDGTAGTTATFTVSLSKASTAPVTVHYGTADGSAHAGTDYTAESGTLTFSPGTVSQTIAVPVLPDTVAKPNETFQVSLSSPSGAVVGTATGTATIVDTVTTPPVTPAATVSFAVTSDWGTGVGAQITITNTTATPINNWSLAFSWDHAITQIWNASVTSQVGNKYVVSGLSWDSSIPANSSVSFGFNATPGNVGTDVPAGYALNGAPLGPAVPSLLINSPTVNDGTAGATAAFTVTLSQPSSSTVTVHYGTADGTAHAGVDYTAVSGTLIFSPGTVTQTIAVPLLPETVAKANESFQVTLSSPVGAGLATATGTATIVDTISAPPTPPVANNITTETLTGVAVNVNVLASASDPLGYTLSLASYTQGAHGTVTTNSDGSLAYTPASGYLGADSFTYTVSDGHGLSATGTVTVTVVAPTAPGNWPAHVFAPYVDMTLYPTYNLVTAMQTAGVKYFTLAFIVAGPSNVPAWGGYSTYEVNGGSFDQSIQAQINQVRQLGGDVSVSFGGENGTELAQAITSVSALTAAYQQVITAYGLTHIDFDIEGAAVADNASIDRRSQAIAALQQAATAAGKTLDVSFTLPVLPTGLTANGLYVLQSALKYGVKISMVNVMAMDFGDSTAPNPQGQMGTYAIDSAQSVYTQLSGLYGTTLSSTQLWGMIAVSPMIGVNDASDEVFGFSDANQLVAFAEKVGLGGLSFWSLTRDQEDPNGALTYAEYNSSSLVQTPYEFSEIFNKITG
ncbi:MAG: cellulose binding domain-containing protein [Isosphaeraceae bacterium]|nr:cellulose binding domain-containing protein [Isosphaeraceae bacterium]